MGLVVVLGASAITLSCALGTSLWLLQETLGELAWTDFLSKWNLGWLAIVGVLSVIEFYLWMKLDYGYELRPLETIWLWLTVRLPVILILVGSGSLVLEHLGIIAFPEQMKGLHIAGIGIGMGIASIIISLYFGLPEEEQDE